MTTRYQKRRLARLRWSRNAVRKKAQLKLERANAPLEVEAPANVFVPRRVKPDLRLNIQCPAIGRLQFSAHYWRGQLIGHGFAMSPKQFGRKLGQMFDLWLKYP